MVLGRDIGIDLGTTSVLLSTRGKGVIMREPAVVAMDRNTGRLLNVGMAAQRMLGRTPGNIVAIRPMHEGAISDYDMTERMLKEFVRKALSFSMIKPRIIISVPSSITEVEERAVIDAGVAAGARKVYLMEAPLAAAIGAGLDVARPDGHMVIDIGGGTIDIAVLSLSGVVESVSLKIGGEAFDRELVKYIKRTHNVFVGENTAEELKKSIGCVWNRPETVAVEVKGRCLLTGLPRVIAVSSDDILEAFGEITERIVEAVYDVLEITSPELVADISENGIILTGGNSQLWGFDKLISNRTHIATYIADDADLCVANGLGKALNWVGDMNEGTINLARKKQMRM
ncbi:MAG: rod shape-determining protein [Oscillospiraceae bacterium]|jgi:rod shape-determining protein MreB|nr:rod shape-determining protein [Oscillospiraceae bacterium]